MPLGITADGSNYVYVCSSDANIVKYDTTVPLTGNKILDSESRFVRKWAASCYGIEADITGNIYVAGGGPYVRVYNSVGTEIKVWGSAGSGDGQLRFITDVAVNDVLEPCALCSNGKCPASYTATCPNSKTGVVYVLDSLNFRVSVFDTDGGFLFKWGSKCGLSRGCDNNDPNENGKFGGPRGPYGIAADETTGDVYVADTEAHRIQKFDQNGNFLLKWGGAADNTPGGIKFPRDVEVDGNGYVYESDTDADRAQVFQPDGTFIMEFQGPHNSVDGPFHPRSIAVNPSGKIFVAAAYAHRIDKFAPLDINNPTSSFTRINGQPGHPADGGNGQGYGSENYLESWGWLDNDGYHLYGPEGIAIDSVNGFIYVADTGNTLIKKFDTEGNFQLQWGYSGRVWTVYAKPHPEDNFDFPVNITTDTNGNVYHLRVGSDYGGDLRIDRMQVYASDGTLTSYWDDNYFFKEGMLGVAYNAHNGRIYVSNTPQNRIQYFETDGTDPSGNHTNNFNFASPGRIAADGGTGAIYIVDFSNNKIYKYDENGNLLFSWGQTGSGTGQFKFDTYSGIFVDSSGYVYAADTHNSRVQVFDANGVFVVEIGQWGSNDGEFYSPTGVVVDSGGFIYVLDYQRSNVQKFSPVVQYGSLVPNADTGGPYSEIEGAPVNLDAQNSSDPDGTIVLYEWDIDNDGTFDYSSTSPVQSHTYAQQGIYTIKLRVTDNAGATDTAITTADISDTSPTANFTGMPAVGASPLVVNFTDGSTGYDQQLTYEWDFENDGTVDSAIKNPSHTYVDQLTYSVKLKVTDSDGSSNTLIRTNYITVNPPEYTLTLIPSGGGNGLVTSSPSGIDCGIDCTNVYGEGTVINLEAVPLSGSKFTGWTGGGCTGTGICSVIMNADTNVTATFELCANPPVIISGVPFVSFQAAYNAAGEGDTIQSQASIYNENINVSQIKSVTLQGGYNCDYSTSTGRTILDGNISIDNGLLSIESFELR